MMLSLFGLSSSVLFLYHLNKLVGVCIYAHEIQGYLDDTKSLRQFSRYSIYGAYLIYTLAVGLRAIDSSESNISKVLMSLIMVAGYILIFRIFNIITNSAMKYYPKDGFRVSVPTRRVARTRRRNARTARPEVS